MQIVRKIKTFRSKRVLFTTLGHNLGKVLPRSLRNLLGKKVFQADFSEIEDFDNIRNPEGIFKESQEKAAGIYNSKASFYLHNGSSSGVIASMLALVKENEKVLIARNAHESVYNSLVLSGAKPVWLKVDFDNNWQMPLGVDVDNIEQALKKEQDVKAVFIASPTYEGIVSDIQAISKVCKKYGVKLFVDEAHGALWNFSNNLPTPAILNGADISVQSLHKTATALNPAAILHISKKSNIEPAKIQKALNLVNTTSPSYPILASIEASINFLNSNAGKRKLEEYLQNISDFRAKIRNSENIELYENNDFTKLVISHKNMSGYELSEFLMKHKIEDEMMNSACVLCLTGIGTDKKSLGKLYRVLQKADKKTGEKPQLSSESIKPELKLTPREAYFKEGEKVSLNSALGRVAKELIVPYPPGIPVLTPGEVIKKEHLAYIESEQIEVVKD